MEAVPLDKLRAIVGPAHVLSGVDLSPYVVDGRTPETAVFPGSLDEVRAVVELAAGAAIPIVTWGGGTAASVGTPIAPDRPGMVLGLGRMNRLVEHEPGDLTATAEAGMAVAAFQTALRARGQWLSLDPPDPERATLGGVMAANAAGPRRHLYGGARDLVIGMTVIAADGSVVRAGGKVVKNVAGYDLPKLFVGSYGTLAVIVDVTVKLRPLPEEERLVSLRFERLKDAATATRALMASDLIPNALELLDPDAARVLDPSLPAHAMLVVGFDGLTEQVQWQCDELASLVGPLGGAGLKLLPPETWDRLGSVVAAALGGMPAAVMRLSVMPAQAGEVMEQAALAARARGLLTACAAHAGLGVVRTALFSPREGGEIAPVAAALADWRAIARGAGGHAVLEWAPLAVKSQVPVWDDAGAAGRIMQRIKAQLDPQNLLNPGRFVAGI
ncbi:MAG TPA: FAD-binding oxidoreductase [Candidatus Acidoferrum sp.]|nr:FAD-binding oxidoreductase [Candidatus Acidoferrum sp.]